MNKRTTTYAVGPNNFLLGMASAFCLFGNFFPYTPAISVDQADTAAIANDWAMVGQDLVEVVHGK